MSANNSATRLDITDLMKYLPHRYPMLLVDRLLEYEPFMRGVALKNVTINEPFFQGHYPGVPVMPGVLIVEAMAQTSGAVLIKSLDCSYTEILLYFLSLDEVKFRHPVVPGDQLIMHTNVLRRRGAVWRCRVESFVDDTLMAEGILTAMVKPRTDTDSKP